MTSGAWFTEFFGEDYLRVYEATVPLQRTRSEAKSVSQLLDLPAGAKILDLCCGYGRHSIELAHLGYQVTGFDLSNDLLDYAREKSQIAGVDVRWMQGDMRRLPFSQEFDAVVNLFTSFGYFESEEEDQGVLDQVCGALKPGGLFIQEIANPIAFLRSYQPTRVTRLADGLFAVDERTFDAVNSRLHVTFTLLYSDGPQRSYDYKIRFYSAVEIARMVRESGMQVEKILGDLQGTDLNIDSGFIVTVSRGP